MTIQGVMNFTATF